MNRIRFLPLFSVFFVLALLIFVGSITGILSPVTGFLETTFIPFRHSIYDLRVSQSSSQNVQENQNLATQLAKLQSLEQDNAALHDQFQATKIPTAKLLPAQIIGAPGFLPGDSAVETYILDKGVQDNIKVGEAVVYKDSVVGKISKVSEHLSVVTLVTNKQSTFAAQTAQSKSLGIVTGQGNEAMILGNVVLSDTLKKGDIVVTKGDIDSQGIGYPPGLVVGKVIAIDRQSSALFQAAAVESLVDFSKLTEVFIVKTYE